MNTHNKHYCKNLDVNYKACQDCKWFAGANDSIGDNGEEWVSTRGVCINESNCKNKYTYVPGDIIFVDADEPCCEDFEELNIDIGKDGYDYSIDIGVYPGYWINNDNIKGLSLKELSKNKQKLLAWIIQNFNWDTILKVKSKTFPAWMQTDCMPLKDLRRRFIKKYCKAKKNNCDPVWVRDISNIKDPLHIFEIIKWHTKLNFDIKIKKENSTQWVSDKIL